ncbi:MAG: hypothetical protein ACRC1H_15680, partial [Caldilineaceae bacterium]
MTPYILLRRALCALSLVGSLLLATLPPSTLPLLAAQPFGPPEQEPAPDALDATARRIFMPVFARGPQVRITRIEVNQGVQNVALNVPLVQSRPSAARVTVEASAAIGNLTVLLSGTRNGAVLPGSPLRRTGVTAAIHPTAGRT